MRKDYSYHNGYFDHNNRPDRSNSIIIAAVVLMVLTCAAIYFFTESMRADENRGCIASAYQATKHGGDLEANLQVCDL